MIPPYGGEGIQQNGEPRCCKSLVRVRRFDLPRRSTRYSSEAGRGELRAAADGGMAAAHTAFSAPPGAFCDGDATAIEGGGERCSSPQNSGIRVGAIAESDDAAPNLTSTSLSLRRKAEVILIFKQPAAGA
jgi:hypothetical protein